MLFFAVLQYGLTFLLPVVDSLGSSSGELSASRQGGGDAIAAGFLQAAAGELLSRASADLSESRHGTGSSQPHWDKTVRAVRFPPDADPPAVSQSDWERAVKEAFFKDGAPNPLEDPYEDKDGQRHPEVQKAIEGPCQKRDVEILPCGNEAFVRAISVASIEKVWRFLEIMAEPGGYIASTSPLGKICKHTEVPPMKPMVKIAEIEDSAATVLRGEKGWRKCSDEADCKVDQKNYGPCNGQEMIPLHLVNMNIISAQLVKPLTARTRQSFVEQVGGGKPTYFVSHNWSEPYEKLMQAILRHFRAKGHKDEDKHKVFYWISVFADRQGSSSHVVGGPEKTSPLSLAIENSKEVVSIQNDNSFALSFTMYRAWCLLELQIAFELKKPIWFIADDGAMISSEALPPELPECHARQPQREFVDKCGEIKKFTACRQRYMVSVKTDLSRRPEVVAWACWWRKGNCVQAEGGDALCAPHVKPVSSSEAGRVDQNDWGAKPEPLNFLMHLNNFKTQDAQVFDKQDKEDILSYISANGCKATSTPQRNGEDCFKKKLREIARTAHKDYLSDPREDLPEQKGMVMADKILDIEKLPYFMQCRQRGC